MKLLKGTLLALFLVSLLPAFASAQTLPQFSHIIIIVQENRTPDNIFGYWATGQPSGAGCTPSTLPFIGADIYNGGYTLNAANQRVTICNVPQPMNNGGTFDPGHEYEDWTADYDTKGMDGFCHGYTNGVCPTSQPSPYSYIQTADVNPYYSIATTYGFANYMFQTNEGPSMVAHQFLFTGTSAPVAPGVGGANGEWWDFVRDNPNGNGNNDPDNHSGCPSVYQAPWIQPDRTPLSSQLTYECYAHDSLMTGSNCTNGVCDKYPNLTWTYYSPLDGTAAGAEYIWDAPEAIPEVCYGENDTTPAPAACGSVNGGTEWNSHMVFYDAYNNAEPIPIFTDISNCKLANISWIIPDLAWSDHPSYDGTVSPPLGPSWVASIVNAIGQSYSNSNQKCDYWGTSGAGGNVVQPTAIFVTWDDWGGFYDHIQPYEVLTGVNNGTPMNPIWSCPPPATNQWGCGNTYGFRVPLLVVSEFTGTKSGANYTGYISGPCTPPNCPNTTKIYQHDFGSILAFTENNFGLQNIDQSGDNGYADYNALDWDSGHKISPLSDFFRLYTGPSSAGRPFVQVPSGYDSSFFENYYLNGGTPAGPDTD